MSDPAPLPRGGREPVPAHVAPGTPPRARRRLLLISFHFPPGASAGALRWQKLSGHAASRGWALDVIALDTADLDREDPRRLEDLPPGTRVFGVRRRLPAFDRLGKALWEAFKWARRPFERARGPTLADAASDTGRPARSPDSLAPDELGFSPLNPGDVRRAFHAWLYFVRDGLWADDATQLGIRLAAGTRYDAVVSCGPPHMAHLAGAAVARRAAAPLAVDFRDPWSIRRRRPERIASPLWFRIAERHERRTVDAADLIVVNTEAVHRVMADRYPDARARLLTVTNGADDEVPRRPSSAFVVTYAGAIYLDRDPRPLFEAAGRVVRRRGLSPSEFRVELVGGVHTYDGVDTRVLARAAGVEDYVDLRPAEPHESLLARLSGSAVLVSLPQDSPWAIPSKVFEYMQFQSWLLIYADPGTPTWDLLEGSRALLVRPHDVDAAAEALEACHTAFEAGEEPPRLSADDERFTRAYQAERLFGAIEALDSRARRRSG